MSDDLRVTVVATGLGDEGAVKHQAPVLQEAPPVRVAVNSGAVEPGSVDYRDMESPTIIRRDRLTDRNAAKSYVDAAKQKEMDYLDIPAFLRRQAD